MLSGFTSHSFKFKSVKSQTLAKIDQICDYRFSDRYAFYWIYAQDIKKLNELCQDKELTLSCYNMAPVKTLSSAIILSNNGYSKMLRTILDNIPPHRIPFHHEFYSRTRSEKTKIGDSGHDQHTPASIAASDNTTIRLIYRHLGVAHLFPLRITSSNFELCYHFAQVIMKEEHDQEPLNALLADDHVQNILKSWVQTNAKKRRELFKNAIILTQFNYGTFIQTILSFDLINKFLEDAETNIAFRENEIAIIYQLAIRGALFGFHEALEQLLMINSEHFNFTRAPDFLFFIMLLLKHHNPVNMSARLKEMINQILASKPNINHSPEKTQLIRAICLNDIKAVKEILRTAPDKKAVINMNVAGMMPLHLAIYERRYEMVELLIAEGADIEAETEHVTPLEVAVSALEPGMVTLLLGKKANINKLTRQNISPLNWVLNDLNDGLFDVQKKRQIKELLKALLSHQPNLESGDIIIKLRALRSRVDLPMVSAAIRELNEDYYRFSTAVKGLSGIRTAYTSLPSEMMGKVLSFVFNYKSETRLADDAQPIIAKWRASQQEQTKRALVDDNLNRKQKRHCTEP